MGTGWGDTECLSRLEIAELISHSISVDKVLADIERARGTISGAKSEFLMEQLKVVTYDMRDGREERSHFRLGKKGVEFEWTYEQQEATPRDCQLDVNKPKTRRQHISKCQNNTTIPPKNHKNRVNLTANEYVILLS